MDALPPVPRRRGRDNAAVITEAPILVVEDDHTTSDVVRAYLERDGFAVVVASAGQRALDLHRQVSPRLVVLDVMLPDRDGFEVAREIRRRGSTVPVLILSARAQEPDRVHGLQIGADDYLVKPFSPRELVARVHALLRRAEIPPLPHAVLTAGNLALVRERHEVVVNGRPLDITHSEFTLLLTLMESPGRVWTRQQLAERLGEGGGRDVMERSIDVYVARLRDKLEQASATAVIETVRGAGYKLAAARVGR
jgi:DNA-binding response OmpR family regulator